MTTLPSRSPTAPDAARTDGLTEALEAVLPGLERTYVPGAGATLAGRVSAAPRPSSMNSRVVEQADLCGQ
jgi:hypothetical protein